MERGSSCLFLMHAFKSNALISLEWQSVIMFIAYNLPGDTLREGIAGAPFFCISVQLLAFGALWYHQV